jgi:hypothetical protein
MSQVVSQSQAKTRFFIHAGPYRYEVKITDKPIKSADGKPALAFADGVARVIWISSDLPADERWDELDHEAWHIHEWAFGKPRNEEERAKLHAAVSKQVRRDLFRQGGMDALMTLRAE